MAIGKLRLQIFLLVLGIGWIGMSRALGTLILVIPTADGVVIAADSRITLGHGYVDGVSKICLVPHRVDLAFALTGQSEFLPILPDGATTEEVRDAWEQGPRQYSGRAIVQRFLINRPHEALDETLLIALGGRLCAELERALRTRIDGRPFFGKRLFRAVVVQFDQRTMTARVGSVRLDLSAAGTPMMGEVKMDVMDAGAPKNVFVFGERRYFEESVFRGVGRRYIADEVTRICSKANFVRDFSVTSAATVARGLIGATAKTAEVIPPATGVGGPLKLFLVNGVRAARELAEP